MPVTISGIRSTSAILVQNGGTAVNNLLSGSLIVGNGTEPVAFIPAGNEGQVLTVVSGAWTAADNAGGSGGIASVSASGNLQGDGTSGSVLTLKDNISLTSVTASFSGSGAGLTGIPNNALQNSSININGQDVPLGGGFVLTTVQSIGSDFNAVLFTGSVGVATYDVVALSGTLVKADYSDPLRSNAIGIAFAVMGDQANVRFVGEEQVLSASSVVGVGTPVYVGPSGSVVEYSQIPSGKYITQIGFKSTNSNKIVIQPRVFGQKA